MIFQDFIWVHIIKVFGRLLENYLPVKYQQKKQVIYIILAKSSIRVIIKRYVIQTFGILNLLITFYFSEQHQLNPLQRSDSLESTQSEREFRKKYQAITHRMVHRKSSAVMYSKILERTFGN